MAKINVYTDCTSDKPSKSYECRRVLFDVAQKVVKLTEDMDGKGYAEQIKLIGELVKIIFPQITDEDIRGIDVAEMKPFFGEILAMTSGTLNAAEKN